MSDAAGAPDASGTAGTAGAAANGPPIKHSFVDVGGLRMHVAEAGGGEPLLLLHGWPEDGTIYAPLIGALAERYRVIVPDLRGFGKTDAPAGGYRKSRMAADLIALLDALGLRDPIRCVGHDWGSLFGFKLCLAGRVSRYVVVGGFHPWPRIDLQSIWAMRLFWYQVIVALPWIGARCVRRRRFLALLYRQWSAPGFVWDVLTFNALTAQFADPARARASSLVYRHWLCTELLETVVGARWRAPLTTPTLFLHGALDGCIDPAFSRMPQRFGDVARVELLEGVGHFPSVEAPASVLERVLPFFA